MNATILQRVLAEKRVIIGAVVMLVCGTVALWGVVVYPLTQQVATAQLRAHSATLNLASAEAEYRAAEGLRDDKTRLEQQLAKFYDDVLPVGLAAARSVTYARLSDLANEHRLVMERRNVTLADEFDDDGRLASLETTMVLSGDWVSIRRFMHALESSTEFMVIERIVLSQSESLDAALGLVLSVATYYRNLGET
jgi:hypothetical protein